MWNKLTTFDKALFQFAVICGGIFAYLLYDDSLLTDIFQHKGGMPIGKLEEISQDVRQKYNKEFSWNKVRKIQNVHLGDSIFTGPNSSVTFTTPDGSTLDIKENSLVVFSKNDNQLSLGLKFGSISGQLNGQLHIDGSDSKLSGQNATFDLSSGGAGKVKITPKSGQLFSVTKSGTAKIDSSIISTKLGLTQAQSTSALSIYRPVKDSTVVLKINEDDLPVEDSTVDFIWRNKTNSNSDYYLIVAQDKDISQIAYQKKTTDKSISTAELKPGAYFAVVREVSDGKTIKQSDVVPFTVIHQPTYPTANIPAPILSSQMIEVQPGSHTPQEISWTPSNGASGYIVEYSTDPNFKNRKSIKAAAPPASLAGIEAGTYYYRVIPVTESGARGQASLVQKFKINPALIQPGLLQDQLTFTSPDGKPIELQWKPLPGATQYIIDVGQNENLSDKTSYRSSQSQTLLPLTKKGLYYYRITALDAEGKIIGTPSIIGKLTLENDIIASTPDPIQSLVEFRTTSNKPFVLNWKAVPGVQSYQVEMSKSKDFKKSEILDSVINKVQVKPQETGLYYYRIKTKSSDNKPGPESKLAKFVVIDDKKSREIASTTTPQMANLQLSYVSGSEQYPKATWEPIPGVEQYSVEVSSDSQFAQKKSFVSKDPLFFFKEDTPGTYYFRVSNVVEKNKNGPLSQTGKLVVTFDRPILTPVEPKQYLPKDPSDKGPPENFSMKWSTVKKAQGYTIQIATDSSFANAKSYQSTTNSTSITLPETGEYFWRVQGLGEGSKPASDYSDVGLIQYGKKDPLLPPKLLEPMDNMTLFFQKSKQTTFWLEWDEAKDAQIYRVELSSDKDFKKTLFAKDMKDYRVLINESLPLGEFYWRVRSENGEKKSAWSPLRKVIILGGKQAQGNK